MTQTVTLRKAEAGDIALLDRLFQRSYMTLLRGHYPPSVLVCCVPVMARAQPHLIRSGQFFVAEQEGRVAGAGGWSVEAPNGYPGRRGIAHMRHVAVDPASARQGIGGMVVVHAMMQARASGMSRMMCQSTLNAVPFYRTLGFEAVAETAITLPGGIRMPVMSMASPL